MVTSLAKQMTGAAFYPPPSPSSLHHIYLLCHRLRWADHSSRRLPNCYSNLYICYWFDEWNVRECWWIFDARIGRLSSDFIPFVCNKRIRFDCTGYTRLSARSWLNLKPWTELK